MTLLMVLESLSSNQLEPKSGDEKCAPVVCCASKALFLGDTTLSHLRMAGK